MQHLDLSDNALTGNFPPGGGHRLLPALLPLLPARHPNLAACLDECQMLPVVPLLGGDLMLLCHQVDRQIYGLACSLELRIPGSTSFAAVQQPRS